MAFELSLPPAAFTPEQPLTSTAERAVIDVVQGNSVLTMAAADTPAARSAKFKLPTNYSGGTITAEFVVAMASATSGNVKLDLQWRQGDDAFDRAFAAAQTATIARPANPNAEQILAINFTSAQIDGIVAGGFAQLRLTRDNAVASNAAGTAWITGGALFEA